MRCTKSILGLPETSNDKPEIKSSNLKLFGSLSANNFICKMTTPLANYSICFIIQGFAKVDENVFDINVKASVENNIVNISGMQEGSDYLRIHPGAGYIEFKGFAQQVSLEIRYFPFYGFQKYEWSTNPILKVL